MADYINKDLLKHEVKRLATQPFNAWNTDGVLLLIDTIPSADVREYVHGEWIEIGKAMVINLDNARQQYKDLGYPHRNELRLRCSVCGSTTMVDETIKYNYCPHCGAMMSDK